MTQFLIEVVPYRTRWQGTSRKEVLAEFERLGVPVEEPGYVISSGRRVPLKVIAVIVDRETRRKVETRLQLLDKKLPYRVTKREEE